MAVCTHPQFATVCCRVPHATNPLIIDTVVSTLKVGRGEMYHVLLELEGFLDQMVLLKVIEKELGVAINHARILAGQASWAG